MNHCPGCVINVHFYVSDVIEGMAKEEKVKIRLFVEHIEEWAQSNEIILKEECFNTIVSLFPLYDLRTLQEDFFKERSVMCALWVIFLRTYRMTLTDEKQFKYKNVDHFLQCYEGVLTGSKEEDNEKLYYTAQWMALCQKMIPGRRNKGFYMHIIPKVIEGFLVKYVTGSGQSKATSWRVTIFEREGSVRKLTKRKLHSQSFPSTALANPIQAFMLQRPKSFPYFTFPGDLSTSTSSNTGSAPVTVPSPLPSYPDFQSNSDQYTAI
jgi:hypothetical protein